MAQKEKLSRMDREIVRLLGRAIDTAIKYGDEINFVTKNGKLAYPYQKRKNFDAEKQLSRSRDLSVALDYIFNLPLGRVDRAELASCKIEDMLMLNLTISVKTSEGNRDFTLAYEECSLSSIVTKRTILDNDIMSYLFFRENFSDSLLKADIEDLTEEQFINALSILLDTWLDTWLGVENEEMQKRKKIFPDFKDTVIKKGILRQEDALNFIFAMSERELFDKIYENASPWECKNAKLPFEMDSCALIGEYWFYWPCLNTDKED